MNTQNDYTNGSSIALKRALIAALLMIGTLLLATHVSVFGNGTAYVVAHDSTTQMDGRTYPQWAANGGNGSWNYHCIPGTVSPIPGWSARILT